MKKDRETILSILTDFHTPIKKYVGYDGFYYGYSELSKHYRDLNEYEYYKTLLTYMDYFIDKKDICNVIKKYSKRIIIYAKINSDEDLIRLVTDVKNCFEV